MSFGGQSKVTEATLKSLTKTLGNVDHELQLLSHASKYSWVYQRLILLRNALIALSVMVFVVVIAFACYRQAYRQTLTIAGFDAPEKLAERGIAGQVIAKALFDELIKRRELVTTLESGELKGAWTKNRADVAILEAKFTLKSVFRYLLYMTGNEITIVGEIIQRALPALYWATEADRAIEHPSVIQRILTHLGPAARSPPPPRAPAVRVDGSVLRCLYKCIDAVRALPYTGFLRLLVMRSVLWKQ